MFGKRHFIKKLLVALVLLGGSLTVFSQVDTAFWFAVPKLTSEHAHTPITLVVSTLDQPATVTVTKAYSGTQVGSTLNVAANSSSTLTLVSNSSGLNGFECAHNTTSNNGLYIHSTAKINAYVAVCQNNSEIYALKGGNGLGTNFFVTMQFQFDNGKGNGSGAYSQAKNSVEIIATENNTTITITPSYACGTHAADVPFTVTLQKGQVYTLASNSQTGANHLCGTLITSDKPVVVDVSDDSVTPHCSQTDDSGDGSADLVADQLVPVEMAGGQYIVVPSPSAVNNNASTGSGGNHYLDYAFVYALEDNTDVTIYSSSANNPTITTYTMNNGDKQKFHFTNQTPIFIYATHTDPNTGTMEEAPVFVFQVTGAGKEFGGTQLPHVYCTGSTAVGYRPLQSAQNHQKKLYLTLLCNSAYTTGFQINGNTNIIAASDWHDIPGAPAFKYCCKDVSTNYSPTYNNMIPFRVINTLGKFHMGVFDINGTFGSTSSSYDDCSISYFSSYTSGSSIAWNPIVTHSDYCQGDTIIFDFDSVDASITRILGPNNYEINSEPFQLADVTPANSGWYTVVADDSRGCVLEPMLDSIEITVHPTVETVVYDTICPGVEYSGYEYFQYSAENTQTIGTLRDTMKLHTAGFGCDSLLILELFIRQDGVQQVVYDTICPGEEYFGYQQFHIPSENTVMPGILTDSVHLSTVNSGCDSLLVLQLTVRDSVFGEFSHTACNQYTWNGHTYRESGDYQQTLEDIHGCDSLVTLHLEIEEPSVEIVTSGDDFCEFGELVLTAVSDYGDYLWNTGDTTSFISVTMPQTLYTVTVTQGNCQASAKYETPDCPLNIFIPSAITPSRPDGKNDYLSLPEYVHRFINDFDIEIYNRWGELIYKTNDMNFRWYGNIDGNGKGTGVHVSDVYVYIMHYGRVGEQGKKYVKKGTVTVL